MYQGTQAFDHDNVYQGTQAFDHDNVYQGTQAFVHIRALRHLFMIMSIMHCLVLAHRQQ